MIVTQTISEFSTDYMGVAPSDRYTDSTSSNEADSSSNITLEWIQTLPQELKDAALYRFCRTIEAKPTLVESFTLNQVFYRTISGGTFTESADNVAERTGCDRKTILKGLSIAVEQNILEKNERPGTSTEYFFKPVEEWLAEPLRVRQSLTEGNPPAALDSPVVRNKDFRTKKVVEFPSSQEDTQPQEDETSCSDHKKLGEELGVVRIKDYRETDSNTVVVSLKQLEEEQQQQEVSIPVEDAPDEVGWKYVGQGIGRVYVLPELDADTGRKIESIHEETKEPRQIIVKRAVDLLYKQIAGIPNFIDDKPARVLPQRVGAIEDWRSGIGDWEEVPSTQSPVPSTQPPVQGIPEDVFIALQNAGIDLGMGTAERLWVKYSDKFEEALAYTIAQDEAGKIKQSKEGFFRRSLEEGWNLTIKPLLRNTEVAPATRIDEPTAEEMGLIDEAIAAGRARDKYHGTHGWLVIRPSGHSEPWRDFLYK